MFKMSIINHQTIALLIFVATYIILATEFRERTIAAMAGAASIWALGILSPNEMISYVDLSAIGLLFGMMVIIGALREAQFFTWIGGRVAVLSQGKPHYLLAAFMLLTAVLSATLDNVTTILFMTAVTIDLAERAGFDPKPYILSEIFASNLGGTATLIGDPPNIMIASSTGFPFGAFITNLAPASIAGLVITFFYCRKSFAKDMKEFGTKGMKLGIISEKRLMWTGLGTLIGTIALFSLQDTTGISPTAVALAAATLLLFIGGPKMAEILKQVEWSTLLFFGSIFVVVGALEKTGWMSLISQQMLSLIGSDTPLGVTVVLWVSSLTSAFIDNIPFAAAFIPVLSDLGSSGANVYPLWWALAAGTGVGGNGTIIGASANVIAIGVAQARGVKISFTEFARTGMVVLLMTTAVANAILLAIFWR
jgi:Na+/H+ antiporter NhaD/arsenite permease-like protein